jgi:N-acetylmuramoyl-L-alanine amidase
MKTIIIDPGHGMSNRKPGVYDSGATSSGHSEAAIVMDWANELRDILKARGMKVVRTRVDEKDPCPVSRRDDIARSYGGDAMLSLHCNAASGNASGVEVFYRGEDDRAMAVRLSAAVSAALELKDRGAKTEKSSQHSSLAVMEFDKCWLIELGFIDHPVDRAKLLDPAARNAGCAAIADAMQSTQ